jgi:hypothetical protein
VPSAISAPASSTFVIAGVPTYVRVVKEIWETEAEQTATPPARLPGACTKTAETQAVYASRATQPA